MALFIRQNEDRSKLQERLSAELQERAKRSKIEVDTTDRMEDSSMFRSTQTSSKYMWLWLLLIMAVLIIVGFFVYRGAVQ